MNTEVKRGSSMTDILNGTNHAPYSHLAEDGVINHNGTIFQCDDEHNRITLGDVTDKSACLNIPLSNGGSLLVNRDNLGELANAIDMFSPEDINFIMRAIAQDKKAQEMLQEIDDNTNSIGEAHETTGDQAAMTEGVEEVEESSSISNTDPLQMIRDRMDELYNNLKNGETGATVQIGGKAYTLEEWDKLLEKFDAIEESLQKQMQEEIEARKKAQGVSDSKKTEGTKSDSVDGAEATVPPGYTDIATLMAQSTRSTDPEDNPEDKIWYITCYTEESVWTSRCQNEKSEEMWRMNLDNKEQYQDIMKFLSQFDKDENLPFAKDEDFWKDFLAGEVNSEIITTMMNPRFDTYGSNTPDEVKQAWMETSEEMGINGFGMNESGQLSHISQLDVQRAERWYKGEDTDVLGDSVESAIFAIEKALYDLENPLEPQTNRSEEVLKQVAVEKEFYENFLEKLREM